MKDGDKKVQWMMMQSANVAVRCDPRFKAYYERKRPCLKRVEHSMEMNSLFSKNSSQMVKNLAREARGYVS